MSKLNVGQNAGYTKSVNDTVQENYPNTIVEAIYWDKEKKPLGEVLEDIESRIPEPGPTPTPGSGLKVIVSTADWAEISEEGVEASTKAEAAQIAGITEDELDFLLDGGDLTPCLFVYGANGGSPDNYSYNTKGACRGQMEEGFPYFQMTDGEFPGAEIRDGAYVIYGFGL